jgi:hypothetical protein
MCPGADGTRQTSAGGGSTGDSLVGAIPKARQPRASFRRPALLDGCLPVRVAEPALTGQVDKSSQVVPAEPALNLRRGARFGAPRWAGHELAVSQTAARDADGAAVAGLSHRVVG